MVQNFTNLVESFDPGSKDTANAFVAGILNHLPGLMVFTVPAPNSYQRLQAGCWSGAFRQAFLFSKLLVREIIMQILL